MILYKVVEIYGDKVSMGPGPKQWNEDYGGQNSNRGALRDFRALVFSGIGLRGRH